MKAVGKGCYLPCPFFKLPTTLALLRAGGRELHADLIHHRWWKEDQPMLLGAGEGGKQDAVHWQGATG